MPLCQLSNDGIVRPKQRQRPHRLYERNDKPPRILIAAISRDTIVIDKYNYFAVVRVVISTVASSSLQLRLDNFGGGSSFLQCGEIARNGIGHRVGAKRQPKGRGG